MITRSPMRAPANTTAPLQTVTFSPSSSGGGAGLPAAALERASLGTLPSTTLSSITQPAPMIVPPWTTTFSPKVTPSPMTTPSPSAGSPMRDLATGQLELVLQALEHTHDAQPAGAVGHRRGAVGDAVQEVLALQAQRLGLGDAGRPDVARARDVAGDALVVDRDLALQVHVVERRHLLRAHDGEAALLVGIQPAQVQVRAHPRREAHEAEDDVLDSRG